MSEVLQVLTKKEKDRIMAETKLLSDDEIEEAVTKLAKKVDETTYKLSACIAERQNRNIKKRYGG